MVVRVGDPRGIREGEGGGAAGRRALLRGGPLVFPLHDGEEVASIESWTRAHAAAFPSAGTRNGTAAIRLSDPTGRERIRIFVDSAGEAGLEFLDEAGTPVLRLPDRPRGR